MIVSTKGRYALRVMIDLAEHPSDGYIPLREIAQRQEISEKYLEQIVSVLKKAGYVNSVRGAQGGYCLAGKPQEYTVGMILRLTEGSMAPVGWMAEAIHAAGRRDARRLSCGPWLMMLLTVS